MSLKTYDKPKKRQTPKNLAQALQLQFDAECELEILNSIKYKKTSDWVPDEIKKVRDRLYRAKKYVKKFEEE